MAKQTYTFFLSVSRLHVLLRFQSAATAIHFGILLFTGDAYFSSTLSAGCGDNRTGSTGLDWVEADQWEKRLSELHFQPPGNEGNGLSSLCFTSLSALPVAVASSQVCHSRH